MPLKGKILNVERARLDKILSFNEIKNLIIALGAGIGEQFDINHLRYHRVITMSVDAKENVMVRDSQGIRLTRIGEFIDALLPVAKSKIDRRKGNDLGAVLCFDIRDHTVRFRPIKAVIRHEINEPLYEIKTAYGRGVRVTASHSVFTLKNGKITLCRGDEIRTGDHVLAPKQINLPVGN